MDTNLLRNWLGLPPGDWPPEPHALLGVEGDGVQERAVALMERLRPHQLRHPELVTEGMNRLAQALIYVEQSHKRKTALESTMREAVALAETTAIPPVVLDAEVIVAAPPAPRAKPKRKRRRPVESSIPVPSLPPRQPSEAPRNRRKAYRNLVLLRHTVRAWERLGPFLGVPSQALGTSGEIFRYLEAVTECRAALTAFDDWPITSGKLARAIIRSDASISFLRDLQHSQRERLAADWANALAEWVAEMQTLRSTLRTSKPVPTWQLRFRAIQKFGKKYPEWSVLMLLMAVGMIAGFRLIR